MTILAGLCRRAHDARVSYLEPDRIGDPDGRQVRVPAVATLQESYQAARHVWPG